MTSFLFQQNLRIGFLFHRLANLLLQELEDDIENRNNKSNASVPTAIPPTTPVPNELFPLAPAPVENINGSIPKS